ncbi:MAG: ABC transporter substrate-binding protein [Pseudomonadota bacterium]
MIRYLAFAFLSLLPFHATADLAVTVGFLQQKRILPPVLSNLDPVPDDLGRAGAVLGLDENAKTGRFLGQTHALIEEVIEPEEDIAAAARALLAQTDLLVIDATADALLSIADMPEAAGALLFNAGAEDTALRDDACRANVLHTGTSLAMRTDGLAQFLVKKRWQDWALIAGTRPDDQAFAEAMRSSGTKFGLSLVGEKEWAFDADMRRNAAQEVPLFTQDIDDHDVLVIADESRDFGRYVLFNTWTPRPVAGSEGLRPVGWSGVVEQWGAAQLQGRFERLAGREMRSRDYAVWAAIRIIGEAVTRTNAVDAAMLRGYILGDEFELAGFKGVPLTFRQWNGQLRQPIPLVHSAAVTAQAPMEGFLHQRNELDTLGLDEPDSDCTAFEDLK